jgi:glycyl-tRNA synthetase
VGKSFRNEITPGNFIFRTREFEQMEIEYFCREGEWETNFEHWRMQMLEWMRDDLGLTVSFDGGGKIDDEASHVHELEVPDGERAHYSKRTIDFEFDFPFGRKELYGLAYRGDFDLRNHFRDDAPYHDEVSGEAFYPHVVEPTWGVDRSVLAVLSDAYDDSDPEHVILKLKPKLAPFVAAVFPLLKNKPELVRLAREVYDGLKERFSVTWDDRGNIGKRYYSQDEIGTPVCITVDFDSLGEEKPEFKDTVTIRHRDTGKQERKPISELSTYLTNLIAS